MSTGKGDLVILAGETVPTRQNNPQRIGALYWDLWVAPLRRRAYNPSCFSSQERKAKTLVGFSHFARAVTNLQLARYSGERSDVLTWVTL